MCILLDSEWADVLGSELLSLALVSAHGVYRFHIERDPLLDRPTDFDFHHDLTVLRHALAALEMPNDQIDTCGPMLQPVMARMLKEGLMGTLVEDCFAGHPQAAAHGHHAMVDAEALRMAWLTVTSPIPPRAWARLTMQSPPEAS